MKTRLGKIVVCLAIVQAFAASAQPASAAAGVRITRAGSQPSVAGPDAFFTGRARVDPIWPADSNITAAGANVTFEAGSRDVIWCPAGAKHWHGASPTTAMTHLSVAGTVDGKNVNWMEKVSDAQYTAR